MIDKKRFNSPIIPKRVVVKVGTSSITHPSGRINFERIDQLMRQLVDLKHKGAEVVLVTSGAIGAGVGRLNVEKATASLSEKQALAAVGQNILMHIYLKNAAEYGVAVGQILITREDIYDDLRGDYSRQAIDALLAYDVIPIINENDAVAVEEIKFGDNDRLSAMVARLVHADWLVILSDIDGLYDKNPKQHADAQLLDCVEDVTPELVRGAQGAGSSLGTGGMATKLMAVAIAKEAGIKTIIANSNEKSILTRLFNGENLGTYFTT